MGVSTEIEKMLTIIDGRKGFSYENEGSELVAKAILLHAKMERECANEVVAAIDEMTKELRGR